ncbi:MAG: cell division transport system ATP-binding protein, partial [Candidatus Azotimanducaceae bacterium]
MPNPILFLRDASIFQRDSLVLSDVNLEINKGEFIYIIGKT